MPQKKKAAKARPQKRFDLDALERQKGGLLRDKDRPSQDIALMDALPATGQKLLLGKKK